jgi:hypothetical protein
LSAMIRLVDAGLVLCDGDPALESIFTLKH